jgi:hypothetical protein
MPTAWLVQHQQLCTVCKCGTYRHSMRSFPSGSPGGCCQHVCPECNMSVEHCRQPGLQLLWTSFGQQRRCGWGGTTMLGGALSRAHAPSAATCPARRCARRASCWRGSTRAPLAWESAERGAASLPGRTSPLGRRECSWLCGLYGYFTNAANTATARLQPTWHTRFRLPCHHLVRPVTQAR